MTHALVDMTRKRPRTFSVLALPSPAMRACVEAHGTEFLCGRIALCWVEHCAPPGGTVTLHANNDLLAHYLRKLSIQRTRNDFGKLVRVEHDEHWQRGANDAIQDLAEQIPFASIGARKQTWTFPDEPTRPEYIEPEHWHSYLAGYVDCAIGLG